MMNVPIQAVPNQTLAVLLGGQSCQINLSTRFFGLYMDLFVSNSPILQNVVCEDRNRIVRYPALGFIGDFEFVDTQGTSDPLYAGLGTRFLLVYLEAADLIAS